MEGEERLKGMKEERWRDKTREEGRDIETEGEKVKVGGKEWRDGVKTGNMERS